MSAFLPVVSSVPAIDILPSVCRIFPPVDAWLDAEDGQNDADDVADERQSDEKSGKYQGKETSKEMHNI